MKGLAPKLGLSAGALALTLLGAEVSLHLSGYDPLESALAGRVRLVRSAANAQRGYELVPGARGAGWGTWVEINSHGFRGPEVPLEAAGRTRIVALGDSVTFGNDLAFEQSWPALLERELGAAGRAVDVLNLGLGGYDTLQEVATLEELGLPYRPEQVIVGYCVNDVGIVSLSMETPFVEEDRARPLYLSRIAQWLHVRALERAQRRALYEQNREEVYGRTYADQILALDEDPALVSRVNALRAAVLDAPSADRDLATRRIPPRWYASTTRIGRLKYAFARLATLAREHGFRVTLLLIPYLEPDALVEQGYGIVRALAGSYGFRVVEASDAFRAEGLERLRIRAEDPVHPNARGHELLARALADSLAAPLRSAPSPGE